MGNYSKSKGRSNKAPPFIMLTHNIYTHPNYRRLNPSAKVLIQDFIYQYRGNNNGDLCAAFSVLKKVGWRSPATVQRAINELLYYGFIVLARMGGRNKANLYALTWQSIDDCKGKLDISATKAPSNDWQQEKPRFNPKKAKPKIRFCTPYMNQPIPYLNQSRI